MTHRDSMLPVVYSPCLGSLQAAERSQGKRRAGKRWLSLSLVVACLTSASSPLAAQQIDDSHRPDSNRPAPTVQRFAPPVHITPGSATAMPPNRHVRKSAPGPDLGGMPHHPQQQIGLQDRLERAFTKDHHDQPQASSQTGQSSFQAGRSVGSGLETAGQVRQLTAPQPHPVASTYEHQLVTSNSKVERESTSRQETYSPPSGHPMGHRSMQQAPRGGEPAAHSILQTAAQDPIPTEPPVRHALLQDSWERREVHAEPSLEWSDSLPPIAEHEFPSHVANQDGPKARPISVLNRQDDGHDFRPMPAHPQDNQFQQDLELLDPGFEKRNRPQTDSTRSLLDDERGTGGLFSSDRRQDGDSGASSHTFNKSCDEFQRELLNTSIRDISLDISPPPINTQTRAMSQSRNWTDRHGNTIAVGTLVDLSRGYVILDNGQKIAHARLSDADLLAVNDHWNIPRVCTLVAHGTIQRNWVPQTYTWTASSLCHKPLYFENIQLERYGHTHGPVMQPIRSVAHFFVSLATLPYHTAIHPANECQYALGLYRPGDCAPWLKDPIPISLSGLSRQALVTTGQAHGLIR